MFRMFRHTIDIILISLLYLFVEVSPIMSDAEETTSEPEEEWHMDYMPTGYLPDSVYRELAWYGVLQVQPLFRSAKHKVAAHWIWQNTLGRPYVILENQPQDTQSDDKITHQTLMEEAAKWAREQRSAVDILMENIRSGGNGLTVRTVISKAKKTIYMIQNGKYFECENGSEPDMDAFRTQTNMHERRCTNDQSSRHVPVDSCLDAEFVPLEYSFIDGWTFCLGDGERDAVYGSDGNLDCGQKTKVPYNTFLEECAIDSNVLISYDYFGDEPRKDLLHNTTLCTTWDPCRISYLYRIEIDTENIPELPSTTLDPCDTTACPECMEGYSEEAFETINEIQNA